MACHTYHNIAPLPVSRETAPPEAGATDYAAHALCDPVARPAFAGEAWPEKRLLPVQLCLRQVAALLAALSVDVRLTDRTVPLVPIVIPLPIARFLLVTALLRPKDGLLKTITSPANCRAMSALREDVD